MQSDAGLDGPLRSVWDQVGGISIHGRVSTRLFGTENVPVVFVHGLGVSMRYLEPTMAALAYHHPVAGLDLPGFGRSGSPRRALSVPELGDSLAHWLDVRAIPAAVFVGNSFGCQVIVDCVSRRPARALGLVLNAPTMDPAHRTGLGQLARVIADIPREPLSLAVHVARDYLRAGPLRLLATLRAALADHIEEKLPRITAPTIVVCGARDPVVTVEWADQVARLVGSGDPGAAGATLQIVPDGAHALPYDDPETFAAIIRGLLDKIEVPSR
ncbi:MAG: alpha/beta hydrolase fold [Gemmatimonadetes bacterium]|nr:alpha/beta hydrolase fold [Gemmatimonadota bacterium]